MNKLVMLNEVKIEKEESNSSVNINFNSDIPNKEEYFNFRNKFCKNYIDKKKNDEHYDNNVVSLNPLNEAIIKMFLLNNKKPFIEFINEIFGDCLGTNCKISYLDKCKGGESIQGKILKNPSFYLNIFVEDEYRSFEYNIQFQTEDYENIAIAISKNNLSSRILNIINLEQKKKNYRSSDIKEDILNRELDSYLIVVNSNIRVPDSYEIRENYNEKNILYKFNILKGWKYSFKDLYKKNLYLLFPLKVFDLKKHIVYMGESGYENEVIKKEISRFFNEMNKYLNMIKKECIIDDFDISEFNIVSKELLGAIYN